MYHDLIRVYFTVSEITASESPALPACSRLDRRQLLCLRPAPCRVLSPVSSLSVRPGHEAWRQLNDLQCAEGIPHAPSVWFCRGRAEEGVVNGAVPEGPLGMKDQGSGDCPQDESALTTMARREGAPSLELTSLVVGRWREGGVAWVLPWRSYLSQNQGERGSCPTQNPLAPEVGRILRTS